MSDLPSISAIKELDDDAWTQLDAELFPKAWAMARSKLFGDYEEDARDIALQALESLQDAMFTVKSTEELAPLLVTITSRLAVDFLRSQRSQKRGGGRTFRYGVIEDWFECDGFPDASDTSPPIEQADYATIAKILQELVSSQPPIVRGCLMDYFYNNKTPAEIAKAYGMKEGAVRAAIRRALDDMHEHLRYKKQLYGELRTLLALPEKLAMLLLAFI